MRVKEIDGVKTLVEGLDSRTLAPVTYRKAVNKKDGTPITDADESALFLKDTTTGEYYQREFEGPVYAEWFGAGAAERGVADSTAGIQRAIDQLKYADTTTIVLPEGTVMIQSATNNEGLALNLNEGQEINFIGSGTGTVVKRKNTATITDSSSLFKITPNKHITVNFRNLKFNDNRTGTPLSGEDYSHEHCATIRFSSGGTATSNSDGASVGIYNCVFTDPIADHFWVNVKTVKNVVIDGFVALDRGILITRSDLDFSYWPKNLNINNVNCVRIEAEVLDTTPNARINMSNMILEDIDILFSLLTGSLEMVTPAILTNVQVSRATSLAGGPVLISNSYFYGLNRMITRGRYNNVAFKLPVAAGAVTSLRMDYTSFTTSSLVNLKQNILSSCSIMADTTAATFTGSIITSFNTVDNGATTVFDNCTIDPRGDYALNINREGKWSLINCKNLKGNIACVSYRSDASANSAYLEMRGNTYLAQPLSIVYNNNGPQNIVMADVYAGGNVANNINNLTTAYDAITGNNILPVSADPTNVLIALRGDIAVLPGTNHRWVCTKSCSAASWLPLTGIQPSAAKSADYTMLISDYGIEVSTAAANRTITLPAVATAKGHPFWIKKTTSDANTVTVVPNGGLIDGAANHVIGDFNGTIFLYSNGTNWDIVSRYRNVVGLANGGTGLSTVGAALQQQRMNAGGTAMEWFTPTATTGGQTIPLKEFYTDVSNSSTTPNVYTSLYSHIMPANTISAVGQVVRGKFAGKFAANNNVKGVNVFINGFSIGTNAMSANNISWEYAFVVMRTGTTTARACATFICTGIIASSTEIDLTGINFANPVEVSVWGGTEGGVINDVTAKFGYIEWVNASSLTPSFPAGTTTEITDNSITAEKTDAEMNTLYPSAAAGYAVIASEITTGGIIYKKAATKWLRIPILNP